MKELDTFQDEQIKRVAAAFVYPPTPDVARKIRPLLQKPRAQFNSSSPRLAWAIALLVLSALLLTVPTVRAALVQLLQAGGITIFVGDETAVDEMPPLLSEQLPTFTETISLDEAVAQFPQLALPTELQPPDDVLLHEANGWNSAVIFLWRDAEQLGVVGLSLYQINIPQFAYKGSDTLEMTEVNGQRAFWLEGPHFFTLQDNSVEEWLFVEGSVLIWWDGAVTYRLEGANSLDEALGIAHSMQEIAP